MSGHGMRFVVRLRMAAYAAAIHAAKGTKSDGGSWRILEYDVRVGCFLSLRQEKRVQPHG